MEIDKENLRYNIDDALINLKRKLKIENNNFWEFMESNNLADMDDNDKKIKLVALCNLLYKR